jgi:hypothetical protein
LIPELEAVGDGLGCRIDLYRNSIDHVALHAEGECGTGEDGHANRRVVESRSRSVLLHGNPHLARRLRSDAMELQGGEQTDDRFGRGSCDQSEAEIFGVLIAGKHIAATTDADKLAFLDQPADLLRVDTESCEVSWLQDRFRTGRLRKPPLSLSCGCHVMK